MVDELLDGGLILQAGRLWAAVSQVLVPVPEGGNPVSAVMVPVPKTTSIASGELSVPVEMLVPPTVAPS